VRLLLVEDAGVKDRVGILQMVVAIRRSAQKSTELFDEFESFRGLEDDRHSVERYVVRRTDHEHDADVSFSDLSRPRCMARWLPPRQASGPQRSSRHPW